ncbi:phosphatidic acid-binding protein CHM7 Ecym_6305 [Eremothecium cymbalariae DBVPG|uniref:Charged multivesicular body protein 7 n=1 Tax=Eremothecium cymbalariae (strain CBS 270.75 / DBVPG 7215 / KCTC 17166 / NRRL Y-17582) TaxID=931890 RepID=G8JUA5_ERECY|nr:hypothetical protein Ecym_6305 [Eremothecium cymbalariae DBVPG\
MLPESRIVSLYSDFRKLKELNPEGYHANIQVWKHHLIEDVWKDQLVIQGGDDLLLKLNRSNSGFPKSIDIVIDLLVDEGVLIPMDVFTKGRDSGLSSWFRWSVNMLVDLSWKSRISNNGKYLCNMAYVNLPVMVSRYEATAKVLQEKVLSRATRVTDLIFKKSDFYVLIEECLRGKSEFELILIFLQHYKSTILVDGPVIKVIDPHVFSLVQSFGPDRITENDRAIADIKGAIQTVETQVQKLHIHIHEISRHLRDSINASVSKELQRRYLKLRKLTESNLSRALTQLFNLMEIKDHIDKSVDNLALVGVLSGASKTLKNINKQLGSIEDLEKLLSDVTEQNEVVDEVNFLLSTSVQSNDVDLDQELQQMENEMKQEHYYEKKLLSRLSNLNVRDDEIIIPSNEAQGEGTQEKKTAKYDTDINYTLNNPEQA